MSDFAKNHLWPALGGLATALLTGITAELPARLGDGVQGGDWAAIGLSAGSIALGYFLVVLQRYGGKTEGWTQPPK